MAGPIALAAALSRMVTIKCPWCGHAKLVERRPAHHRVCPRCKRQFPDPFAKSKAKPGKR